MLFLALRLLFSDGLLVASGLTSESMQTVLGLVNGKIHFDLCRFFGGSFYQFEKMLSAAANVLLISSSRCMADTNPASNAEGAK